MWMCQRCSRTYLPEVQEVRKDIDFFVPIDTEHNIEPAVTSMGSSDYIHLRNNREPIIKGGLKSLKDKGLKITNYSVTDGAGRPIREKEDE